MNRGILFPVFLDSLAIFILFFLLFHPFSHFSLLFSSVFSVNSVANFYNFLYINKPDFRQDIQNKKYSKVRYLQQSWRLAVCCPLQGGYSQTLKIILPSIPSHQWRGNSFILTAINNLM